jgi:steroid 5-alpha reductase family enzyme
MNFALATGACLLSVIVVLSPIAMTYRLDYATGGRLTQKYLRNRPGSSEYRSRTPFFVPRPSRVQRG